MYTNIDFVATIPINFILAEKFFAQIGVNKSESNHIKRHANQMGHKFLIKAPDGHVFINVNLFNQWSLQNNFSDIDLKILQLPFTLIKANLYASITGYTIKAIERKREDKIWGPRLAFKDPIGLLTINITEVEKWIQQGPINGK